MDHTLVINQHSIILSEFSINVEKFGECVGSEYNEISTALE